ncbi:MAG: glycosyltransferase [Verrucomicrobiota bacterium]
MPDTPEISFVLPAYNEAQELPLTLTCLHQAARCQYHFNYEVVVCDNDSNDGTAQVAKAHDAHVVHEAERQISRARNAGASAANGQWLIFLDADTRINQILMASVLRKIRSGCYGLIGSQVKFDIEELDWFPLLVINAWNQVSVISNCAAGSFIACPHQAFRDIGGFHLDFFAGEEIDFSLRMLRWGRKHGLKPFIESQASVITSGRKIRGKSTWDMVRQLAILFPGALSSKAACDFWYDDKWRN